MLGMCSLLPVVSTPSPTQPSTSLGPTLQNLALVGGIAGGVGGFLFLMIIVLVVIVVVLKYQVRGRGHYKFNVSGKFTVK